MTEHRLAIDVERPAADVPAFEFRPAHAGTDPLDDERAFQFRDDADDGDDGAAEWPAGVELFTERDELKVEMVQLIEHFQEVANGAGQSVAGPDHHHIEVAAAGVFHHLIEAGAARLRAADAVLIGSDDLELALLRQLLEIVELRLRVLIEGGDAQVNRGAPHSVLLQRDDLVFGEVDHPVQELEARPVRLRLLRFQHPLELEGADRGAYVAELLVKLGTGRSRAKMAATAALFHGDSPGFGPGGKIGRVVYDGISSVCQPRLVQPSRCAKGKTYVPRFKEEAKPWYSDQILPFDITLCGANEMGAATTMKIFGVEILNEGSGVSIDDAVTEMQATFVARYVEPWTAVQSAFNTGIGGQSIL
jgi:hypothetical protein